MKDPVIARALDSIPVPDHGPMFWAEIEARLAGDETYLRRSSHPRVRVARVVALVAAAVIVIVAVGVASRGRDTDHRPPATVPSTTTTTVDRDVVRAEDAVTRFIDALGRGDRAGAAALVGPRSEEYAVAVAGSVDALLTTGNDGYGGWAHVAGRGVTTLRVRPGDFVVVLEGLRDGVERADAIPVRHAESADAWFVEPWAFDPQVESRIELVSPDPAGEPPVLDAGNAVQIAVPASGRVWFSLGHRPLSGGDQVVAGGVVWEPPADLRGNQLLVAVYENERTFTAFARPITIDPNAAQSVAHRFFDAWLAGDRAAMEANGTTDAVDAAIARRPAGTDGWEPGRCEGAAGSIYCTWTRGQQHVTLRVANLEEPRRVVEFRLD